MRPFKVGDRVVSKGAGVGEVISVHKGFNYPVMVVWGAGPRIDDFTEDGWFYCSKPTPYLDITHLIPKEEQAVLDALTEKEKPYDNNTVSVGSECAGGTGIV